MSDATTRPPRQAVLIVADGDYIEVFGSKSIDVHFARMPQASNRGGEQLADVVMEAALPLRYRDLYDRSLLRANGIAKPLSAEVALYARAKKRALKAVDEFKDEKRGQVA